MKLFLAANCRNSPAFLCDAEHLAPAFAMKPNNKERKSFV